MGLFFFFFFQAEDGIRDIGVTGVQTCALPISADAAGAIVQVGYMRGHAAALADARAALAQFGEIRFARVHDFLGRIELIIEQTSRVIRPDDATPRSDATASARRDALVNEAVGALPATVRPAYDQLLSLGCHGISTMRRLLGPPAG